MRGLPVALATTGSSLCSITHWSTHQYPPSPVQGENARGFSPRTASKSFAELIRIQDFSYRGNYLFLFFLVFFQVFPGIQKVRNTGCNPYRDDLWLTKTAFSVWNATRSSSTVSHRNPSFGVMLVLQVPCGARAGSGALLSSASVLPTGASSAVCHGWAQRCNRGLTIALPSDGEYG